MVGAGGHARVCLEALLDDHDHIVVGAVSSDGAKVAGLPVDVLGRDADLAAVAERTGAMAAFVAVGDNEARARLTAACRVAGLELARAVSASAVVSPAVGVGEGTAVLQGAVVNAATRLGQGVIVNTNASIDHDCIVGEFTHVAPGVAIGGGCTIGARVLVGIGARVIPGVTIGDGAVVGAGAVVLDDVAAGATVVGVPARPIERPSERPV
jgi:UDP-perosamine 4-acetyltransferase